MTENKEKNVRVYRSIWLVAACLFAVLFLFSAYKVCSVLTERNHGEDTYSALREELQAQALTPAAPVSPSPASAEPVVPDSIDNAEAAETSMVPLITMDFTQLKAINPDVYLWIHCDDTPIDYPVLRADDNDYYVGHMYDRKPNSCGAIFMDYRNSGMLDDLETVIYGHHMVNDSMFSCLVNWRKQEFFDSHPTMSLLTPWGDYRVELLCGTVKNGDDEFIEFPQTDEELQDYVRKLRSRSDFVSPYELQPGDHIVSLITCTYEFTNARYQLVGRLVPLYQEG